MHAFCNTLYHSHESACACVLATRTGHSWVQASVNDASMWPPSEKRKLDVFKRAANKATDDRAIARVMHILMRCVLSQRKVGTSM